MLVLGYTYPALVDCCITYIAPAGRYRVGGETDRSQDASLSQRDRVVELQKCKIALKSWGNVIGMNDQAAGEIYQRCLIKLLAVKHQTFLSL